MTLVSLGSRDTADFPPGGAADAQGKVMGPSFHPSARLCSEYRIGDIAPGAALAVATHLSACAACATLAEEPEGAADRAWTPAPAAGSSLEAVLPPLLRDISRSPWRNLSHGVSVSALAGVSGLGEAVYLLRARPGAEVPLSDHADILLMIDGAADLDAQRLGPGDFVALAAPAEALADAELGALALVVGDDDLYRGLFGRRPR